MSLESVETDYAVFQLTGVPSFAEVARLEHEILSEAEVPDEAEYRGGERRTSPTTFHLAIRNGVPLGVASSTVGPLTHLPLGLALQAAGVDLAQESDVPGDPACELVSLAVDPTVEGSVQGVTEALYRSFYRHAKESQAVSAVAGVDPWILDLLVEQYGMAFRVIGPPLHLLGRELLAIGASVEELERSIRSAAPRFATYLNLPYRQEPDPSPVP